MHHHGADLANRMHLRIAVAHLDQQRITLSTHLSPMLQHMQDDALLVGWKKTKRGVLLVLRCALLFGQADRGQRAARAC